MRVSRFFAVVSVTTNLLPTSYLCRCFSGQAVMKWHKMGSGDVQVLPYLILTMDGSVACPVRICDLSEKHRYPVVFSNTVPSDQRLPCVFMTAQQCDGQVFLTLWDENVPQITIHNMSQLSLNVIASRSENGERRIHATVVVMRMITRSHARDLFSHHVGRKRCSFAFGGLELEVSSGGQVFGAFSHTESDARKYEKTDQRVSHVRCRE